MDRKSLEKIQREKLLGAVKRANKVPFLRQKLREAKLDSINGPADIAKLPFTYKKDILECFPFGALAVPLTKVARIHTSSGSTNKPITTFYTKRDLLVWSELMARGLAGIGAKRGDVFQNTTSQGLFTGGLGLISGAERLGLVVIPLGSANPEKQLETMRDFGVSVFHTIPSFGLRMAEVLESKGKEMRAALKIRLALCGAEPWTKEMRRKIEDTLEIDAFNNYGFAEAGGPGIGVECVFKNGLHIWEDHFIMEVVDPKTGEQLEPEEEGELVITPLDREAMPILRYRTGDITRIIDGKCECGRTHRMIDWMRGRIDDMIKVRGIGLYPSNIEKIIASHAESNGQFQIILSGIDDMLVKLEVNNATWNDSIAVANLKSALAQEIKRQTLLRTDIEVVASGNLPRSDGKAKRIIDLRRMS
jgi:phenylacetate-CoA ligase